jgi:xylose isomerase
MAKKLQGEIFPGIGKIRYEGKDSKNPLAFRWYDAEAKVGGKKMKDVLRYAIAYWHSFCGDGTDTFGGKTRDFPHDNLTGDDRIKARQKETGVKLLRGTATSSATRVI